MYQDLTKLSLTFEQKIITEVPAEDSTAIDEKELLYQAIRDLKPSVVVETGTHRGLTSLYLAHALFDNGHGHLHTADPYDWDAPGNFRKFPELEQRITYHRKPGFEMIRELSNIDFAFIDGFHEKHEVVAELLELASRLSPGAVVYLHDTAGSNVHCDVPGALEQMGWVVEFINSTNGMAKYVHKNTVGMDDKVPPHQETVGKTHPRKRANKLSKPRKKKRVAPQSPESSTESETPTV